MTVDLTLWDTAGQEDYDRIRPVSYPGTDVVLICFSFDARSSLVNVTEKWLPEIRHHCPSVPILLVGTKLDLRHQLQQAAESAAAKRVSKWPVSYVSGEEAAQLAKKSAGIVHYVECSAKTGEGVKEVFVKAAEVSLSPPEPPKRSCSIT